MFFQRHTFLNHQVTIFFYKNLLVFCGKHIVLPCFVFWNVELLDEPPAGEIVEVHARVSLRKLKNNITVLFQQNVCKFKCVRCTGFSTSCRRLFPVFNKGPDKTKIIIIQTKRVEFLFLRSRVNIKSLKKDAYSPFATMQSRIPFCRKTGIRDSKQRFEFFTFPNACRYRFYYAEVQLRTPTIGGVVVRAHVSNSHTHSLKLRAGEILRNNFAGRKTDFFSGGTRCGSLSP